MGKGRITDKLVNVQVYVSNVIVSKVGGKFCNKKRTESQLTQMAKPSVSNWSRRLKPSSFLQY